MIQARRLLAVGAILGVAAIFTCSQVWGVPGLFRELRNWHKGDGKIIKPDDRASTFADDLNRNRFSDTPVVVYQADKGEEAIFGLQVLPKLPDSPARPKDYLVIVDTSASKAMGPLTTAGQIARDLAGKLGPDDRMAIWVANIAAKDLTRGFQHGKALDEALAALDKEVLPLGRRQPVEEGGRRRQLASFGGQGQPGSVPFSSTWVTARASGEPLDAADPCRLVREHGQEARCAFFAVPPLESLRLRCAEPARPDRRHGRQDHPVTTA